MVCIRVLDVGNEKDERVCVDERGDFSRCIRAGVRTKRGKYICLDRARRIVDMNYWTVHSEPGS